MKTYYEDVFFYLDLTKDFIRKKELIKAIKNFIYEKNKSNIKGHYGLLIFQEEGNPVFIIEKKDSNIIANAIEENWKSRPRKKSFFENGLFYIFSYFAETVRKKSKVNRIIVITDTPSDLSEDYAEALFNLVSKIKDFPTFIDIIRISKSDERFFKDDVKLNILASDTKGNIFYTHHKKDFYKVIDILIQSKQLIGDVKQKKLKIKKEDYKFYSRLAKELIPTPEDVVGVKCYLCKEDICPVCTNIYDLPNLCENCGSIFHSCCITNFTIQNNIGIPHIFRCPSCDILLKIKQDEIVELPNDSVNSVEEYIESETTELKPSTPEIPSKQVRIGGFFGKFYSVEKQGDKLVYKKISQTNQLDNFHEPKMNTSTKEDKSIVNLKTLDKLNTDKYKRGANSFTCPECGTQIEGSEVDKKRCLYCGHMF
ncbi:MAG: hypothetical protein ACFE8E_02115 [Candidatus Hodarchaeota archaeon]